MKVLIAGGGTAGHINPGVAIARTMLEKNKDTQILFVGTKDGLESEIVPREGFNIAHIRVSGFKRSISLDSVKTFIKMFQGYHDALRIIKRFNPDVVVGTGGYVCGPVLFAASLKKIPTMIHEQNAFIGVTNKILSRFVKVICISFKESKAQFKTKARIVYTGNPIRPEIMRSNRNKGRKELDVGIGQKLVVVMGGSRGAEKINDTMIELIQEHYPENERTPYFKLVWATGDAHYQSIMERFQKPVPGGVKIVNYIYNVADAYAASDLCVCRAGANTITEIAVIGTPSILIPSPYVTANHQEYNARVLVNGKGAEIILEKELTAKGLYDKISKMLRNEEVLDGMRRNLKGLITENAAEIICAEMLDLINNK